MLSHRLIFPCFLASWLWCPAMATSQTVAEAVLHTAQSLPATPAQDDRRLDLAAVAQLVLSRTNAFRQDEGRPPVAAQPQLMHTARDFANFMARTDLYGHTADGNRPAQRAKQHAYDYCIVSENIATSEGVAGSTAEALAQQLFQGWKQSPEHRRNMLHPHVTDTGVAVARSQQSGHYYAVQMFGRPRSKRLEFHVANRSNVTVKYAMGGRTWPLPPRAIRTHQRCSPAALTFQWPGTQEQTTVQPYTGERYTILREGSGRFRIKSER